MSIISNSLISDNLRFAIGNITATLTAVTPTNTATYVCNKQGTTEEYSVLSNGREVVIDTRFYLAIEDYPAALLPTKGMILTDGTKNYQVISTQKDAANATLRIDCGEEYQS